MYVAYGNSNDSNGSKRSNMWQYVYVVVNVYIIMTVCV